MSLIQQLKQAQDFTGREKDIARLFWNIRRPLKICHPENWGIRPLPVRLL